MEMSALTFFSWVVMLAEGWSFLVVDVVALVEGSAVAGSGDWPAGSWLDGTSWPAGGGWPASGGWPSGGVGSGGLGLATRAAGQ